MQRLQFESAWDRTLSVKDREHIEQVFSETKSLKNKTVVHLTPLWQAVNHKGELLVTVLVHNTSKLALSFHDKKLRCIDNNEVIAEHTFTLPSLTIEPETSMPWTFIFPVEGLRKPVTLDQAHIEIVT